MIGLSIFFAYYHIGKDTEWLQRNACVALKNAWNSEKLRIPDYEKRYYIKLPAVSEHRNYMVIEVRRTYKDELF